MIHVYDVEVRDYEYPVKLKQLSPFKPGKV